MHGSEGERLPLLLLRVGEGRRSGGCTMRGITKKKKHTHTHRHTELSNQHPVEIIKKKKMKERVQKERGVPFYLYLFLFNYFTEHVTCMFLGYQRGRRLMCVFSRITPFTWRLNSADRRPSSRKKKKRQEGWAKR